MRRMFIPGLLSLLGCAMPIALSQPAVIAETPRPQQAKRRKTRRAAAVTAVPLRRSRGTAAKPKRHPNRNHISRRVRRRHRRKA